MSLFLSAIAEFQVEHARASALKSGKGWPSEWWAKLEGICHAACREPEGVTSEYHQPVGNLVDALLFFKSAESVGQVMLAPGQPAEIVAYEKACGPIGRALEEIRLAKNRGPDLRPNVESPEELLMIGANGNGAPISDEQLARMLGVTIQQLPEVKRTKKVPAGCKPPNVRDWELRTKNARRLFEAGMYRWQAEYSQQAESDPEAECPESLAELIGQGVSDEQIARMKGMTIGDVQDFRRGRAIANDEQALESLVRELAAADPKPTVKAIAEQLSVEPAKVTAILKAAKVPA